MSRESRLPIVRPSSSLQAPRENFSEASLGVALVAPVQVSLSMAITLTWPYLSAWLMGALSELVPARASLLLLRGGWVWAPLILSIPTALALFSLSRSLAPRHPDSARRIAAGAGIASLLGTLTFLALPTLGGAGPAPFAMAVSATLGMIGLTGFAGFLPISMAHPEEAPMPRIYPVCALAGVFSGVLFGVGTLLQAVLVWGSGLPFHELASWGEGLGSALFSLGVVGLTLPGIRSFAHRMGSKETWFPSGSLSLGVALPLIVALSWTLGSLAYWGASYGALPSAHDFFTLIACALGAGASFQAANVSGEFIQLEDSASGGTASSRLPESGTPIVSE